MKKTILISVLFACASAVVCSLILVKPSILFRNEGSIRVKGSVSQNVESDVASWYAEVWTSDALAQNAYKKIRQDREQLLEFLKSMGLEASDVSLNLSLRQVFKLDKNGFQTAEVSGYKYTLSLSYSSCDVALVEKLSSRASSLVEKGISINSNPPQYFYSKLENLKLELMAKASENAKERAKLLVAGSGAKLGKVLSASQGVFQITGPLSTETSDYGMYDTSSRTKQVTCVVTLQFAAE